MKLNKKTSNQPTIVLLHFYNCSQLGMHRKYFRKKQSWFDFFLRIKNINSSCIWRFPLPVVRILYRRPPEGTFASASYLFSSWLPIASRIQNYISMLAFPVVWKFNFERIIGIWKNKAVSALIFYFAIFEDFKCNSNE